MDIEQIKNELTFRTAKSSGSGGQHVNKVETKVELMFDVQQSKGLSETEKALVSEQLKARINKLGILQIAVEEERSQVKNKELAIRRFIQLMKRGIKPPKVRKYKPVIADEKSRLQFKQKQAEKKSFRKKVDLPPTTE